MFCIGNHSEQTACQDRCGTLTNATNAMHISTESPPTLSVNNVREEGHCRGPPPELLELSNIHIRPQGSCLWLQSQLWIGPFSHAKDSSSVSIGWSRSNARCCRHAHGSTNVKHLQSMIAQGYDHIGFLWESQDELYDSSILVMSLLLVGRVNKMWILTKRVSSLARVHSSPT